jgi:hypothetical protein
LTLNFGKFAFGPCKVDDWDAAWMTIKAAALVDEETRKDFDAQLSFSWSPNNRTPLSDS